jgi:hypothetical protein
MRHLLIVCLLSSLLGACGRDEKYPTYQEDNSRITIPTPSDFPTDEELKATEIAEQHEKEIEDHIRKDRNLNWIRIGISTGKFSESISHSVYKTWTECQDSQLSEANTCIPVNALPASYWKARG